MADLTFIFDTSILIALERKDKSVLQKLKELALLDEGVPCISFATQVEFLIGIENAPRQSKASLKELLWSFQVLHTTNETALNLAILKCKYDSKCNPKSIIDLLIASQALEHNLTLITRDKDFKHIKEIKTVIL